MSRQTKFVLIAALAIAGASCNLTGPSESLTGTWNAQGVGHSSVFSMTLIQDGDEITGTACHWNGGAVVGSVAVRGEYPDVRFLQFSGRQDSTGDIVGTYRTDGTGFDLRFRRATTPAC
jgi:hypothetical protein